MYWLIPMSRRHFHKIGNTNKHFVSFIVTKKDRRGLMK